MGFAASALHQLGVRGAYGIVKSYDRIATKQTSAHCEQLHTQPQQLPRQHQGALSCNKARLRPLDPSTLQYHLPDCGSVEWRWCWLHLVLPDNVIAARPHHLNTSRNQAGVGNQGLTANAQVPGKLPWYL